MASSRRSAYAVIRVERSGTGKSEGAGCDKLDYDTEVRHYREAFDALVRHPWVDPERVVIYGSSLGATTAPLVAQGKRVAGILVQGGGALTYFERMVNFDRHQLERQEAFDPARIDAEMRRRIAFQRLYLHQRQTPAAIEAAHRELRGVWASLLGTKSEPPHYGRPYAWHWQAAEKDWLAAWAKTDARVMVVYGEFDQYEALHGHRAIVDTVERLRPGSTRWLEIAGADHSLLIYPDRYAAYAGKGGERRWELFVDPVAAWLREIAR
ncbi:MAG: alpha/beta hydrolase [Novosphingobium sp.]|nr:alpha/beta hydrolase [Novosphingobium sp.]